MGDKVDQNAYQVSPISHYFINILISTGSLFQVLASTNGMYDMLRFKTGNFLFE